MGKRTSRGLWVVPFILLVAGGCQKPVQIQFTRDPQLNEAKQALDLDLVLIYASDVKQDSRWDPKKPVLNSRAYFTERDEIAKRLGPGRITKLVLLGDDTKEVPETAIDIPQLWDKPVIFIFGDYRNAKNDLTETQPVVLTNVLMLPRPVVVHVGKERLSRK